jgi:hypothetical protein
MRITILPAAAAAVLAVGGGGIAASLAADAARSDSRRTVAPPRQTVTPPRQTSSVPPAIRAGSSVSRVTLRWIRMTVRGHGPNAGRSMRFRIDAGTSFFRAGVGRISIFDIRLGDRLTVSYHRVGDVFSATRVVDHGRLRIRA